MTVKVSVILPVYNVEKVQIKLAVAFAVGQVTVVFQFHTFIGQTLGNSSSDARPGSGYKSDFVVQ